MLASSILTDDVEIALADRAQGHFELLLRTVIFLYLCLFIITLGYNTS